jgi:hypothetical protein
MQNSDLEKTAMRWILDAGFAAIPESYYCATRDVFQARLDNLLNDLLIVGKIDENAAYLILAIAGEIGNNSFDHNLGNWPNVPGIFFAWRAGDGFKIILADRGRGIRQTLKRVKPEIENDQDALKVAFFEKISGRAPEARGNGLKFVRESVKDQKFHLSFVSGDAIAELNNDFNVGLSPQKIDGCLAVIKIS